jgi:hypothetical protein
MEPKELGRLSAELVLQAIGGCERHGKEGCLRMCDGTVNRTIERRNHWLNPRKGNAMSLPPSVEPYFRAWIMVDTWHTGHLSDLERFYKFVWSVHRYCRPRKGVRKSKRRLPSDGEIRNAILDARSDSFNAEALEREAQQFSMLYTHLLDFANTPSYPNHLIEKKNILQYYSQLICELGGFEAKREDVASCMRRDWGEDWEQKLDQERSRLG